MLLGESNQLSLSFVVSISNTELTQVHLTCFDLILDIYLDSSNPMV